MNARDVNQAPITDAADVIVVSCYSDLGRARDDFDDLTHQIKQNRVRVRYSVLLGKNLDGMPIVLDTSSGHHGRTGAIVGASMGFVVGLLTLPALPVSVMIGAITGAAVTQFADHEIKAGLRHDIVDHVTAATGVVISIVRGLDEMWTRHALRGASTSLSLSFPETTIASLERAVVDAMDDLNSS